MHHARKGLTLIEVLIIVVMVGILLTITWTKFTGGPVKRVTLSLKADVDSVMKAESNYFAQHNAYGNRAQLDSVKAIVPGDGNVLTITPTATGYTVVAKHENDVPRVLRCSLDMSAGESAAAKVETVCN